jgi:RNA-splicing ligase RtcB
MPSVAEHIAQARRNEKLFSQLLTDAHCPEWAVVVLFYAAVHYGRGFVIKKGGPTVFTSHRGFETHFRRR